MPTAPVATKLGAAPKGQNPHLEVGVIPGGGSRAHPATPTAHRPEIACGSAVDRPIIPQ